MDEVLKLALVPAPRKADSPRLDEPRPRLSLA